MKSTKYECAMCHGVFDKGRDDSDALAEMERYFGDVPEAERCSVCDVCFQLIHPEKYPEEVEKTKAELRGAAGSKGERT